MNMSENSVESDYLLASLENSAQHSGEPPISTSNQQNQLIGSSKRKQKSPKKKRKNHVLRDIRKYQQSGDFLIPKSSFCRLLREIISNIGDPDLRLTVLTIQALQESCETYMTYFFQDAYACTLHRNRVTLSVSDMRLVRFLRGPNDPANY